MLSQEREMREAEVGDSAFRINPPSHPPFFLGFDRKVGELWCTEGLQICCKANISHELLWWFECKLGGLCASWNILPPVISALQRLFIQPLSPKCFQIKYSMWTNVRTNGTLLQAFRLNFNNSSPVNSKPLLLFLFVCLQAKLTKYITDFGTDINLFIFDKKSIYPFVTPSKNKVLPVP